jgi:hypothetical protein
MLIKKLHIFFLLVFCLYSSCAQAAKQEQLLLVMPEMTGQAPSPKFLSIIHSAVFYLNKTGSPLKINIVSKEPLASDYAKVILHSYRLRNDQIKILKNFDSLNLSDLQDLEVFGGISLKDQTYLTRHELVFHDQDLSISPSQNFDTNGPAGGADLAIIALGTEPLDKTTPSLDMVKRVETAIGILEKNPQAICIFSGGRTAGPISEAKMMSLIAYSRGAPPPKIFLEEGSLSTIENAQLTAQLVDNLPVKRFVLVTRPTHMKRAMSIFKNHPEFKQLQPRPTGITKEEIIKNFKDYLAFNRSDRVKYILRKILLEYHDN